jgi:hypothetical protein
MARSTERPYRSQPWTQQREAGGAQVRDGTDDSAREQGAERVAHGHRATVPVVRHSYAVVAVVCSSKLLTSNFRVATKRLTRCTLNYLFSYCTWRRIRELAKKQGLLFGPYQSKVDDMHHLFVWHGKAVRRLG